MKRKIKFVKGEIYHVFNKSIAGFGIFKDLNNCQRFLNTLDYYNDKLITKSFSKFLEKNLFFIAHNRIELKEFSYVKFIAYCIMPDHYHLLVKLLKENSFSKFLGDVENSFTRFFNTKFERKGPLWQSEFKAVRIKTNEQLLHVSRYIHLNPTSSDLVVNPEDWEFSSYRDYINNEIFFEKILNEISIKTPESYKKFIKDQKDYQRSLKKIKNAILE